MSGYLTLDDIDVSGKRILVRSDLNVPLEGTSVTDDFRIRAALGTITKLRDSRAIVTVCSHLGRPKGLDPEFSMKPIAARMQELAGYPVKQLESVGGVDSVAAIASAEPGDVFLLENTRFEPGETKNDPDLSDRLAGLCDFFVQDAFGSVHRAHSSTVGVAERVKSVAGPLLDSELAALGRFISNPDRPYVVVLGGAKISDKLAVIQNLLPSVDAMLIGGGMCFTLLAAEGYEIGDSLVEEEMIPVVREILEGELGSRIQLPVDMIVADRFAADANNKAVAIEDIAKGWRGLDIGPKSVELFSDAVKGAASVFWNGPMGVFEFEAFRKGTEEIGRAMGECEGFTAVGGGDSAAALRLLGLEDSVSHLSTGGGAGLELLEGKDLPGVSVLERWV